MLSSVRHRSSLVASLLLVGSAGLLAAPGAAAADGAVTDVGTRSLSGGYSPYLFFGCDGVAVTVQDATPSDASAYAVTVGGRSAPTLFSEAGGDAVTVVAICPQDLEDGATYDVSVTESGQPAGPAFAWRYDAVTMPSAVEVPPGDVQPGELVLPLVGEVEPGAAVTVKAVANEGGTRQEAIENNVTEIDVPATYDAAAGALVLQVPDRAAGRFLWVSMSGALGDQVPGGLRVDPLRVAGEAPYDASWIESVGSKQGRAVVGRRVAITAPEFTSPGAARATTVRYRWFAGGRALPTTSRSLVVTRSMVGKRLAVRASFSSDGTTPLVRTIGFGTVRR